MDKEYILKRFEKNVDYLHRNIPPDDIYLFAEQTLMAAVYFLREWNKNSDVMELCATDPVLKKWVTNISQFFNYQELDINIELGLGMEETEP